MELESMAIAEIEDSEFNAGKNFQAGPLPIQLTKFIGRQQELDQIKRLLTTTRLLRLTGAGGVGKTRLALEAASQMLDQFADGVRLVELAPLADEALLPQTVAAALSLLEQANRPAIDTLIASLQAQNLLLLLDNCEHLIDGSVRLVDALLHACPDLRILATSREVLNVPGEVAWLVPSLSLSPGEPEALEELMQYDAVRLFVERSQAALPSFSLTPRNAKAVEEICRQLDGIPLALELAAARMRTVSVEQIAVRLQDRFRLLTTGGRTVVPRHQTLRSLVDWSHDLLSEPARTLLRRLAIFAGGWTLEAAESICAGDGIDEAAILDLLSQLLDKSLALAEQHETEKRYRLLETVRQYAAEKLQESGEERALRHRHLVWFRELAERLRPGSFGPEQAAVHSRLETELNNLRAALQWSKTERTEVEEGLRLSGALTQFWYFLGHTAEGEEWLSALLALAPADTDSLIVPRSFQAARAEALTAAAFLATRQRHTAEARALCERAVALWRGLGDKSGISVTLTDLGVVKK